MLVFKKISIFAKKLKNMKFKALLFLTLILIFSSCTYYEQGPTISLKNANTRISGDWELTDVLINDKTDEVLLDSENDIKYSFGEEGTIVISYLTLSRSSSTLTGEWQFNDDKTSIILVLNSDENFVSLSGESYKILRLTDEELWLSDEYSKTRQCDYIIERRFTKTSKP